MSSPAHEDPAPPKLEGHQAEGLFHLDELAAPHRFADLPTAWDEAIPVVEPTALTAYLPAFLSARGARCSSRAGIERHPTPANAEAPIGEPSCRACPNDGDDTGHRAQNASCATRTALAMSVKVRFLAGRDGNPQPSTT